MQWKFEDDARVEAVVLERGFFELERDPGQKNLDIIGLKRRRLLRGKDLFILFAHDRSSADMECSLELTIDVQIAAFKIFQKHEVGTVVENCSKPRLTFRQSFLDPSTLGRIDQRVLEEIPRFLLHRFHSCPQFTARSRS